MSRIYCDTITKEVKGFDNVVLYHGFNAFFVNKPYRTCFNTLMRHPEYQICTSTKYIGMMGVCIKGDILIASNLDLFSGIDTDDNNRRYFDDKDIDNLVYDYADLELHEDDPEENNEIVIHNTTITGVWITSDAPENLRRLAADIAKENNLPLIEVGESIFA